MTNCPYLCITAQATWATAGAGMLQKASTSRTLLSPLKSLHFPTRVPSLLYSSPPSLLESPRPPRKFPHFPIQVPSLSHSSPPISPLESPSPPSFPIQVPPLGPAPLPSPPETGMFRNFSSPSFPVFYVIFGVEWGTKVRSRILSSSAHWGGP